MFVPLLLTLHVWQAPAGRPRPLAPALATPALLDALLAEGPPRLVDPHAGEISGAEVAAAAVGGILGSAGAVAAGLEIVAAACALTPNTSHQEVPACLVWGVVGYLAAQLALPPLFAATAVDLVSEPPTAGSFGRAAGYAFAAQGVGLAASIVLGVLALPIASGSISGGVFLVAFGLVEVLGLPLAASYGMHDGPAVSAPPPVLKPAPEPPQLAPPPSYTPPPPVSAPLGLAVPF